MTGEWQKLTIRELQQSFRRGELSPVELTRALLTRIEAVDGGLNCYLTVAPEEALRQAEARPPQ